MIMHPKFNLFTIGVYGSKETDFFKGLIENKIDLFCDIRRRRGVRGAKYSYVNSKRLQARLAELEINYTHLIDLSPSNQIREKQKIEDKKQKVLKRDRKGLGDVFIKAFQEEHLDAFNFNQFYSALNGAKNVVLFCVELDPQACHRSLVANYLEMHNSNITLKHL